MTFPPPTRRTTPLQILSTSDWHLGNRRVPSVAICERLRRVIFPHLTTCHLLNIGGDVWDTLVHFSDESNVILSFIIDLLKICDAHRVIVRVLLGTFTHDRTQSSVFPVLHEKYRCQNDLKYIDRVCLEEIETLDLRILYLPDDLPYQSSEACLDDVKEMMAARGWTYVDYVFGHGYFDHMLPPYITKRPKCTFTHQQFSGFVRRYICMGHIHLSDITDNILYNNSFDRLAHGEEAPKGCLSILDYGTEANLSIIENPQATKFLTFNLTSLDATSDIGAQYLARLKTQFSPDEYGYVRIIHPSAEIRQALGRLTATQYPRLVYSVDRTDRDKLKDPTLTHKAMLDIKTYPIPTHDTLPYMLYGLLGDKDKEHLSVAKITDILLSL